MAAGNLMWSRWGGTPLWHGASHACTDYMGLAAAVGATTGQRGSKLDKQQTCGGESASSARRLWGVKNATRAGARCNPA